MDAINKMEGNELDLELILPDLKDYNRVDADEQWVSFISELKAA